MECFHHSVNVTNYTVYRKSKNCSDSSLASIYDLSQHPYVRRYCPERQNPLDWEQGELLFTRLKTERYNKEIINRCLPHDAGLTKRSCLRGGGERLFSPLWCGWLHSLDGGDCCGGTIECFIKTCPPGKPSQQPKMKKRTRLAYRRSSLPENIIKEGTHQNSAQGNMMFDHSSSY